MEEDKLPLSFQPFKKIDNILRRKNIKSRGNK